MSNPVSDPAMNMAWRVHLSNRPIRRLDWVAGEPSLLAVWGRPERSAKRAAEREVGYSGERVALFDLHSGDKVDDRLLQFPQSGELTTPTWSAYLLTLTAPNKAYLPVVRLPQGMCYTALHGRERVLHAKTGELVLVKDGQSTQFAPAEARVIAFAARLVQPTTTDALDENAHGKTLAETVLHIAALDQNGCLLLFRGEQPTGKFGTGLTFGGDTQPMLAVSAECNRVFVSDGQQVVVMNEAGQIVRTHTLHYAPGTLAPSLDGKHLAVSDLESGVIRIYNVETFTIVQQRFGVDWMAEARCVQASSPASRVNEAALGPMLMVDANTLAFAMGGTLCVTPVLRIAPAPGAQTSATVHR